MEIAFIDQTDNQFGLSFHCPVQVVWRRLLKAAVSWGVSLPGHPAPQRVMWGLRYKILESFIRWHKTSLKLPCWAKNILIPWSITLLLAFCGKLQWEYPLYSGKSAWLFCHHQIGKFLPHTPIWCIWLIESLLSTDLKMVLQRRAPSGAV